MGNKLPSFDESKSFIPNDFSRSLTTVMVILFVIVTFMFPLMFYRIIVSVIVTHRIRL